MFIILDSNNLCHMMKHTMSDLSFDEKRTGIIFGFLRQVLSLSKKFNTNNFIFVWDSSSSIRKEVYSEYKGNRKKENKTKEEAEDDIISFKQFSMLREEILPKLGFVNVFIYDGYEADDLTAQICISSEGEEIAVASSDNDMYQLLTEDIYIYDLRKKEIYTKNNFILEYGIEPSYWKRVKSIAGCASDNVPGIVGVGEKTAIKYLLQKMNPSSKSHEEIKAFLKTDEYARNLQLVSLPYIGTPKVKLKEQKELSADYFIDICQRFGFSSFMNKEGYFQWKNNLRLV